MNDSSLDSKKAVIFAAIADIQELKRVIAQRKRDISAQQTALNSANKKNSPERSRRGSIERGLFETQASLEELEARERELEEADVGGSKKRKAADTEGGTDLSSELSEVSSDNDDQAPAKNTSKKGRKEGVKVQRSVKGRKRNVAPKKPASRGERSSKRIANEEPELLPEPVPRRGPNTVKRALPHAASDSKPQEPSILKQPQASTPTPPSASDDRRSSTADDNPNDSSMEVDEPNVPGIDPIPQAQPQLGCSTQNLERNLAMPPVQGKQSDAAVENPISQGTSESAQLGNGGGKAPEAGDGGVKKKVRPRAVPKGKELVKAKGTPTGGDGAESSEPQTDGADDIADGEDDDEHVFTVGLTARQQKLEEKAQAEVERYLRNPQERLSDNVRTHIRTRANHCPEAATSCFPLARDCLITGKGSLKCVYHVLVDKVTKKRDRGGMVALTGVPYPPQTNPKTPKGQPEPASAYLKCKLPIGKDGQEHCHCGCAIEDAVWGLLLWKTGKMQYMGRVNGYEFTRNPPTPAQRNFEITRLKSLGFQLDDFFTHELDKDGKSYRERERYEIALRQIARLQRELGFGPQLSMDGLLQIDSKKENEEQGGQKALV
ncbi:hypothetical protein V5O48_009599 [Marasmius crinis-equi]|uniref:Uncharacterized protein n=1 Tax=Marasmius crinis-equi TaxID=585013 RepID=A0ABR3FAN6_9AGAR